MSEASEAAATRIRETDSVTLINEVLKRVEPILTHKREPSLMSIPPNFDRDDDVYVCDRLLELRRRLSSTARKLEALQNGLQKYLDGDYPHPRKYRRQGGKCPHGRYYYEECEACNDGYIESILAESRK